MPVTVKKDLSGLDDFRRRLKTIRGLSMSIGFQGRGAMVLYPDGTNVASVAAFNEFGTKHTPKRSFLNSAMFENREAIGSIIALAVGKYLNGKDGSRNRAISALAAAAKKITEFVRNKIDTANSWATQNAPSTIKAKGHNTVLIETNRMINNLSWAVRDAGGAIVATSR
jgi:hypothetical protein